MKNIRNKALSIRIDDSVNSFIENFSKKINLSKTETVIFMLKRSIGLIKYENNNRYDENSIVNLSHLKLLHNF